MWDGGGVSSVPPMPPHSEVARRKRQSPLMTAPSPHRINRLTSLRFCFRAHIAVSVSVSYHVTYYVTYIISIA